MKRKERFMAFREKLSILWRGMKTVWRLEPAILSVSITNAVVSAFSPFINIYMIALILDELPGAKSVRRLAFLVGVTIGLNLLVHLIRMGLERMEGVFQYRLFYKAKMDMDRLILSTDYENVEQPDFHLHKQKIDEGWNMGNRGIWNVARQLEAFVSSLFTVGFSLGLAVPLFLPGAVSSGDFIVSPWLSAALLLLVTVSSVFSVLSNASFSKKLFRKMDGVMPINRVYFFYASLVMNPKFGKDVRIYSEQHLIKQIINDFSTQCGEFVGGIGKLNGRFQAINAAISAVLGGMVYVFVGLKALAGIFSIGSVVKYVGAINQFTTGLSTLITSASEIWMNTDYVKLYLDFLDTPNVKYMGTLPVEKRNDNQYEIEFKNISFKYPGTEAYALRDFSLKLKIGERLAVVGMNGSGKTTMIKLLCRLYDPQEGEILLNGINIQKYDYQEYLSLFSVVFQDFKLFAFSAGQNVAAAVDYDRDKAMEALDQAGAGERIRQMPKGLDTPLYKVDEDGVDISGGEEQKIALARALYKDAPFIVLDEPTAALDPIAEFEIYSRFNDIVGTKTAIYISHRLSSCRFCNDIAVFHEGRLIQRGSHDNLIKDQNGKYYELWNAQAQYYKENREVIVA